MPPVKTVRGVSFCSENFKEDYIYIYIIVYNDEEWCQPFQQQILGGVWTCGLLGLIALINACFCRLV